jgi:hypothetical protein
MYNVFKASILIVTILLPVMMLIGNTLIDQEEALSHLNIHENAAILVGYRSSQPYKSSWRKEYVYVLFPEIVQQQKVYIITLQEGNKASFQENKLLLWYGLGSYVFCVYMSINIILHRKQKKN